MSTTTRVVGASVFVGAVSAAVLSLVVLPGATESVTTGSLLVGFGLGWAALVVLSARFTDPDPPWARVPAAAMTGSGVALMVLAPQDDVLSRLTWLWAPALLALTAWTAVQVRRSPSGRGRWLLAPVLAVLALAALGGVAQTIVTQRDLAAYPAP